MDDWFKFGSKVGRFTITRPRHHGAGLQRYDALDRSGKRPAIITCAKPDRKDWAPRFERLIEDRSKLDGVPSIVGHGITPDGVFFIAEDAVSTEPLSSLPWGVHSTCTLMYAIGKAFFEYSMAGFAHGALDPRETLFISGRQPTIYGVGVRQILGCLDGPGVLDSAFTAPEILEGKPWDGKADVFALCSIVASLWGGREPADEGWAKMGAIGTTIQEGMQIDLETRICWDIFYPVMLDWMDLVVQKLNSSPEQAGADAAFAKAIAEEWQETRPSAQPSKKPISDTTPVRAAHRLVTRTGVELFEGWLLEHEGYMERENIETCPCYPVGADDVDLLRRTRLELDIPLMDAKARLGEWMEKRSHVKHSTIAALVAVGVRDDGWAYWVEEGTDTKSFRDWVKRPKKALARHVRAVKAVRAWADALGACAALGVYHGDLVVDRDLLVSSEDEEPLIFGIGALQGFGLERSPTQNPYAAPERRAGDAWDQRADIYALGAILCEAVTGSVPKGDGVTQGLKGLDWWLSEVISLAISPNPGDRFQTWSGFVEALDRCIRAYEPRALMASASVATPRTAPTTAPAKTPTSWTPSSSDPTPPPAPQGAPSAEREAAREAALVAPANQNGQHGPKGMEGDAIDRETLPSPLFVYPPPKAANEPSPASAKASRIPRWIASRVGLPLGVAACFAVLWSARTPTLDSTPDTTQETQAFEAPIFRPTINTAEAVRSTEKPRTQAHEFEGVAYRFDKYGQTNGE